jgi:hypothetical protein
MNDMIDLEKLYRQEQRRWLREEAPRRSFRDILTGSVPYWIVLVALVLYGLSAPPTAGVFDKLTPGWGFIARLASNSACCMPPSAGAPQRPRKNPCPGHSGP